MRNLRFIGMVTVAMFIPTAVLGAGIVEQELIDELDGVNSSHTQMRATMREGAPKLEEARDTSLSVCDGNLSLKDAEPNTPCRNQLLQELEIIDQYERELRGSMASLLESWARAFAVYIVAETYCGVTSSRFDEASELLIKLASEGDLEPKDLTSTYTASATRAINHIKSGDQVNCQAIESLSPRMEGLLANMRYLDKHTANR